MQITNRWRIPWSRRMRPAAGRKLPVRWTMDLSPIRKKLIISISIQDWNQNWRRRWKKSILSQIRNWNPHTMRTWKAIGMKIKWMCWQQRQRQRTQKYSGMRPKLWRAAWRRKSWQKHSLISAFMSWRWIPLIPRREKAACTVCAGCWQPACRQVR